MTAVDIVQTSEHFDIPVVKVCAVKNINGEKKKKCGFVKDPNKVDWKSLDNNLLPTSLSLDLDE